MEVMFRIINSKAQAVTFCNLTDNLKPLLPKISNSSEILTVNNKKCRCGIYMTDNNKIYFISDSKDYISSSSKFKKEVQYLINLIDNFLTKICDEQVEFQFKRTQRLSHNIRSINGNCITSFFSYFPQEELSKKDNKIQSKIQRFIDEQNLDIPNLLLKLHKNHLAVKTEFEVFEKLYDKNPFLSKKRHKVHRVLMNVYYPFFSDFQDKGVNIDIKPSEIKSVFDYDTLHVAFFHIFENTHKYSKNNSTVDISISEENNFKVITFEMESLAVDHEELPLIFQEGWSSNSSKTTAKSGSGLGMYIVKRLIELNNGTIEFTPIEDTKTKSQDNGFNIEYQKNLITIKLPS